MILPFMVVSHFKLKAFLMELITFHLDACFCIEHAESIICTHSISDVTHTLGQAQAKMLCLHCIPMFCLSPMEGANKTTY
jgi:hypothetical protein